MSPDLGPSIMSTTPSSNPASRRPQRQGLRAIFLAPLVIAIVSTAGLISALVGDGVWDVGVLGRPVGAGRGDGLVRVGEAAERLGAQRPEPLRVSALMSIAPAFRCRQIGTIYRRSTRVAISASEPTKIFRPSTSTGSEIRITNLNSR